MTDQPTSAMVPAEDNRLAFGQTSLRPQDFVPPRVKVVQQMSQEFADKLADPGDLFNTLTRENYGPTLRIQPILPFMTRALLVREERRDAIEAALGDQLPEGGGLMCRSLDMVQGRGFPGIHCDECPLSKWDEMARKPPLCMEIYNVAAANELGELVILSFQKSSAKVGRRFFSAIRMATAAAAPWTKFYEIATTQQKNEKGTFFVPDFKVSSERPDTGQLKQALFWAEQLKGVVIDVSPVDEEEEGGAEGNGKEPF